MIDIKILKKPKNEGSTSALNTSGTTYGGMAVKEAAHAARADMAELAKEATHAKESDHAAEADHTLKADWAAEADEAKHAQEADHAKEADNADKWDGREFADYLDQPVRTTDGVAFDQVTTDMVVGSGKFVDGLLGSNFRLWKDERGLAYLTVDKLTVRQTMSVMELLINKVRSVGGQICVSAANGKIKTVEEQDGYYIITFEEKNMFVAHDLVRCQTFTGNDMRGYWVEVTSATKDSITVAAEEFGSVEPKAGDECVLMGNTENADRQNLVLISATEDGQPRVDVMDGVKDKTFDGALRARLGNLKGISDDRFPANRQPKGNGLYADNAYLKGTFLLETGEDVKTRFEVTEGKIESAVEGLRQDFASDRGYLNNPSFADGMDKWATENETVFFLVGNRWVWTNGKALAKKGDSASVTKDMGRTVVRIRNKYIRQSHANLQSVPKMAVNAEGKKTVQPVYLAFFYRCAKAGRLTIEFENVDKAGFEDFNSMSVEENLTETDGYTQYTCSGLWNGTGDFKLGFTGDIYLYMLILSTDKVESLTYKYKTLFEQSEKLVRIAAENFDKDGKVLEGSEIITTAKYNTLMSERFNEDGTLKNRAGLVTATDWEAWQEQYGEDMEKKMDIEAFAGMFASAVEENTDIVKKADVSAFVKKDENGRLESGVHIGADQITLEGVVTANGNFKILEDGSMEAKNGKFKGEVTADSGTIGGFEVSNGRIGVAVEKNGNSDNPYETSNKNTGLFLYPNEIGFNGADRQVIVGNIDWYGNRLMGRFIDDSKQTLPVDGLVVAVRGSFDENVAIRLGGGCIGGMAYKNKVVGFGDYETETKPGDLTVDIDRYTGCVYAAAKMNWHAKSTDKWQTVGRDIYLNLPEMQNYDDGHTIKIKRGPGSGSVYIVPGNTNWVKLETVGFNTNHVKMSGKAFIVSGRGIYDTEKLKIESEYDAMELVYFRDLMVTVDGTTYHGGWVQWKNPRDW